LEIEGKGVEEFYNQQLGTQKYNEKTIQELRTSENEQEKKFAKRYSTQILTAMMESYLLNWNKKGKLSGFRHSWNGTTKGEMSLSLNDTTFLQKFSLHLQNRIAHNPFTLPDLEPLAQIKTADELQIRSYAERDKKSESLSKAIQKKVEQTLPNVEWQGKRGDVTFNPEDSTLESR
jgi:hypothetical protein